jgi:hypothetical protein
VIIPTLGRATVLQAASFPEWQDEADARASGRAPSIEEHS